MDDFNKFSLGLLGHLLSSQPEGNVVLGSSSIWEILLLLLAGAKGQTREEISEVMGINPSDEEWVNLFREFRSQFKIEGISKFAKIFLQRGLSFNSGYLGLQVAGLEELDFMGKPEVARQLINSAVSGETRGLISQILSPGSLDRDTKNVLVSATFFLQEWVKLLKSFYGKTFITARGNIVDVPFLQETFSSNQFSFYRDEKKTAVGLPFKNGCQAVFILPAEGRNLEELIVHLQREESFSYPLSERKMRVFIPKASYDSGRVDLASFMRDLGLRIIFSSQADFSRMSSEMQYVSGFFHQAVLHILEKGVVGADATAMVMRGLSIDPEVSFDRPHLVAIVAPNGAILSLVAVRDPSLSPPDSSAESFF